MHVRIQKSLYEHLIATCKKALPNEACGFLTGIRLAHGFEISSIIPVSNQALQPERRFEMSPAEIIPLLLKPDANVVGIYHSHPAAPAAPSQEDLSTLWHTLPTYWIISLQDERKPEIGVFQIKKAAPISFHKLAFAIDQ